MILPLSSLWLAAVANQRPSSFIVYSRWVGWFMWGMIGLTAGLVLIWWFPEQPGWFWVGLFIFLFLLFYSIQSWRKSGVFNQTIRLYSAVLVVFWILNAAFFNSLLFYQGGNQLAQQVYAGQLPGKIYSLKGCYSSSFYFYTRSLREEVSAEELKDKKEVVLLDQKQLGDLNRVGVSWKILYSVLDYEITKLTLPFLDPKKREGVCSTLMLVELSSK